MNEDSKLSAEYCGVCWHDPTPRQGVFYCYKCCDWVVQGKPHCSADFTTPDGWQLIADKMNENEEWEKLYRWIFYQTNTIKSFEFMMIVIARFHEKQPAKKSKLFADYLREVEK